MAGLTDNRFIQSRGRWFAFAGILAVVAGMFTALRAWSRLAARPMSPTPRLSYSMDMLQSSRRTLADTQPSIPLVAVRPASTGRVVAFLVVTIVLSLILILLQNDSSSAASGLFLLLVISGAAVGLRSRSLVRPTLRLPGVIRWPLRATRVMLFWPLRFMGRLVLHFRYAFAAIGGLGAATLFAFSALSFEIAYHNFRPMDEAVQLALGGIIVLGASIYLARPNILLPALPLRQVLAVPLHLNWRFTVLGGAVLLVLSEINGKVLHRYYVIHASTHAQFAILVVGITLVAIGLSGWQSTYRLPNLHWRVFIGGLALIVIGGLVKYATDPLPLIPVARGITDALLFWGSRVGTILIALGFLPLSLKLPRRSLSWTIVLVGCVTLVVMLLLAQSSVLDWLDANPGIWLLAFLLIGVGIFFASRWLGWRFGLLTGGVMIALVVLAHLQDHILINTAYNWAVDLRFWWMLWLLIIGSVVGEIGYNWLTDARRTMPGFTVSWRTLLTPTRLHYITLGLIIIVGFFTRFYLLNDATRFLIDEESFISATRYLRVVPDMELLIPFSSIAAFPYVFPYWQMLSIDALGATFLGLRATAAILGALTVPALYFLAHTLFDRKVALVAALLMATFPVHVHFSRIGISEVASPVFGTLAFAFLARGLKHGRRVDYALAGVMLGLTHYFHEGGRLLYTPLAILWVGGCLLLMPPLRLTLRSIGRGAMIRNLFITAAALVIVAAPIYYTLVATDRPLFARMVTNNSGLSADYWKEVTEPEKLDEHIRWHLLPAFQVYLFQIDNTRFYAGHDGLIPPFVVPFFLLGVFYAFWRPRSPGTLLLLGWLLTTSLGNSLMVDSAGSPRYVMVFPALMLTAAVGIRYTAAIIARNTTRQNVLIAIVVVALAYSQTDYYFNIHLPLYNQEFRAASRSPDGYDAALRSLDFPPGTQIHIISRDLVNQIETAGMIGLVRTDMKVDTWRPRDVTNRFFNRLQCRVDHAFFLERGDFDTLSKLREHYYIRRAQFSTNSEILPAYQLVLYYAPYIKGSEEIYGRDC